MLAFVPKRYSKQRVPYSDQLRIVDRAKSARQRARMTDPTPPPRTELSAAETIAAPPLVPQAMSTLPAQEAQRTVRAVRVQITMVSINTSKIPKKPCLTGLVSLVAAWAIGAEPRPASLEKQPRAMPFVMEVEIVMPNAPPKAASALKAPLKIMPKTWPIWPMLARITIKVEII